MHEAAASFHTFLIERAGLHDPDPDRALALAPARDPLSSPTADPTTQPETKAPGPEPILVQLSPTVDATAEGEPAPAALDSGEDPPGPVTGPLATRIIIDEHGLQPVVRGTHFKLDPPALRQALKDNHFNWKKDLTHWLYEGPPSTSAHAVAQLRHTIDELDSRHARTVEAAKAKAESAKAKPSYPPTAQQQAIIDACLRGLDAAVQALA
ncbi:hypothetical protein ACFQX6_67055 [Streptosporangium lutulentum]